MKIAVTEALQIDLEKQAWQCRKCGHEHGAADTPYKELLRVRAREPQEVHRSIIDASQYDHTFAPKSEWVNIVEYYCSNCALLVEAEYLPPGHPPVHDIEINLEALRELAERLDSKLDARPTASPNASPSAENGEVKQVQS